MQGTESTQNGVIRVRVSDLLFALQKRWVIIVALSLVGLTFGLILSAMTVVRSSYQSFNINGSFAVTSKNLDGQYVGGYNAPNVNDFHLAEDMVDAVRYVLRSERVLSEVINENELLGYTVAQIRSAITVTQYNSTQILEMRLTWRNAEEGLAVWNGILRHASDILPKTLQLGSLEIINEPVAELVGVVGGGNNKVVLLTLLGFAAGVGFAVVELLMHPTLNNVRDVETLFGLETIGVIPRDNAYYKRKGSIMTRDDVGNSLVVQNFSAAAYILRNRLGSRDGHQCFYVTSAIAGEGKTTVAANLGIQLSDMEHKTLLIDFDTRNPNLGALFLNKVDYEHSLNALYRGDVTTDEAITTLSGYLDILPAVLEHNAISVDNMLIELVENLKQRYEYVIMDAPPVGEVSGTLSLNQVADSVLFVIGYDQSSLPEIQSSLEKLDKSGTRVLGCIVNSVVSGKAIGMTPSADERKKNISQKAAKKKQEEEKYGFDDDGKTTTDVKTGDAKGRKKKEKKGSRFSRHRKEEQTAPVEEKETESGDPPKRRNIYEDTLEKQEQKIEAPTTQETINELVRIGLSNDWGSDQPDAVPDNAEGQTESRMTAAQENASENTNETDSTAYFAEESTFAPEIQPDVITLSEQNDAALGDSVALPASAEHAAHTPAVRTISVRRRTANTTEQSATPGQIVILDEDDAADTVSIIPDRTDKGAEEEPAEKRDAAADSDVNYREAEKTAESDAVLPAAKTARPAKKGSLLLYILLAIPVTALCLGLLLAAALLFTGLSAAGFAYGAIGLSVLLHTYTALADKLVATGLSLSAFALALLMLWLVFRTVFGAVPSLIRAVASRGRKWCGEEVEE